MDDLAHRSGLGFLGPFLSLGFAASFLAGRADRVVRCRGGGGDGVRLLPQHGPRPRFPPLNLLPYVFVGCMAVGLAGYAALRFRNPQAATNAGTYAEDAQ
ncbi:hypothetical protein [Streptomyces sp. NPDC102462]|uniref:hypothetical protein n=1 Tax=Streptomyces sp. NPDC102462 TaxID=3366178 RepID=UPI003812EAF3